MITTSIEPDQEYEVALVNATLHPVKTFKETFFKTKEDAKIEIVNEVVSMVNSPKISAAEGGLPGVVRFATAFNLQMQHIQYNVRLVLQPEMKSMSLVNEFKGRTVSIPGNWVFAFGFDTTTFPNGTTYSIRPFDEELYKKIDANETMLTRIFKVTYNDVFVAEPSPLDVIHLVSEINKALENYHVEAEYDGKY
jgi:hypothetical protein